MAAKLARLGYLGLAKETTQGTLVTPTIFIPSTKQDPTETINPIVDESIRANPARTQGIYGGAKSSTFATAGWPYPDTIGHLFAALGMTDTLTTGTGAAPNIHTFARANAQPTTYSLTHFDALTPKGYPGCMLNQLTFKGDVSGAVEYETDWVGWASSTVSAATPSYTAVQPFLGWEMTAVVAAAAKTNLRSCELTLNNDAEVIMGSTGSQGPRETFADGLKYTFKYQAIFDDETDYDRFLAYLPFALTLTFTAPTAVGGASLVFGSPASVITTAKRGSDGKWLTLDVEGEGVSSSNGPVTVVLRNSIATAY